MGQVPAKYMLPSAPYGQSDSVNAVNAVQPAAMNPQTPLLPPNFQNPPTTVTGSGGAQPPRTNPFSLRPVRFPGGMPNYRNLYGQ